MRQFYQLTMLWVILNVCSTVLAITQTDLSSPSFVDSVRNRLAHSIGTKAPDLVYQSLENNDMCTISSFRGKTLLLKFWNRGCPPCIEEMPVIARLQDKYNDANFCLLFLSHDDRETQRRFFSVQQLSGSRGYLFSDELNIPYQTFVAPM